MRVLSSLIAFGLLVAPAAANAQDRTAGLLQELSKHRPARLRGTDPQDDGRPDEPLAVR